MLCKEIVWISLETDTNLVKHAIRFGLFNISSTPITAYSGVYVFLDFKWHIKLKNRLRTEGEKIIYVRGS